MNRLPNLPSPGVIIQQITLHENFKCSADNRDIGDRAPLAWVKESIGKDILVYTGYKDSSL